jgi:hypothetical protein
MIGSLPSRAPELAQLVLAPYLGIEEVRDIVEAEKRGLADR